MTVPPSPTRTLRTDPDAGIPDLIRRLGDDSKRLVNDEIRLAKLEAKENLHTASRGALRLGVAFGIAVVALTGLTVLLASVIGRALSENYWAGALITGALELIVATIFIKQGLADVRGPSYTFDVTRAEVRKTARWASEVRDKRGDGATVL